MGSCPYCGEQLEYLYCTVSEKKEYVVECWDKDFYYDEVGDYESQEEYFCPYCGGLLTTKEDEIHDFLRDNSQAE